MKKPVIVTGDNLWDAIINNNNVALLTDGKLRIYADYILGGTAFIE